MKSAAAALSALTFATAVLAQSSTSSAQGSTSTATPSTACYNFLEQLDKDSGISTCLNSLISHTSAFDPSTNSNTTTAATITTALDQICPDSFSACNPSTIRAKLGDFFTNCQTDLLGTNGDGSNGNRAVIDTYDVLYLLVPLKNAICSKNTDGKYCVNSMPHTTTTGSSSSAASASASATHAKRYIEPYRRSEPTIVARGPNDGTNGTSSQLTLGGLGTQSTQMNNDGLPYLFMTNTTSTENLCTHCTAEVVGAYIAFENVTPYALGLSRSPILSGQIELWQKLKTCNGGQLVRDILNATMGDAATASTGGALAGVRVGAATWFAGAAALLLGVVGVF